MIMISVVFVVLGVVVVVQHRNPCSLFLQLLCAAISGWVLSGCQSVFLSSGYRRLLQFRRDVLRFLLMLFGPFAISQRVLDTSFSWFSSVVLEFFGSSPLSVPSSCPPFDRRSLSRNRPVDRKPWLLGRSVSPPPTIFIFKRGKF